MILLSSIIGIVITLLILSLLVLIHEFGHFIVAKRLGIKVEEFGFGFPPKAFSKKIGETEYSINWIPIGGFVKLYGEDEAGGGKISLPTENIKLKTENENEDLSRAFFARPVWQRSIVILAGVAMNAFLAFIVFYVFLFLSDYSTLLPLYPPDTTNYPQFSFVKETIRPAGIYIEDVTNGSPAKLAGIISPAKIISINGKKIGSSEKDINTVQETINKNKGKEINLQWVEINSGIIKSAQITPRLIHPKNEGSLGIALNTLPVSIIILDYDTKIEKILSGISHPLNLMSYNFIILKELAISAVKTGSVSEISMAVSSPVGIAKIGGEINQISDLKLRFMQFLNLAGLISISLAVFNVLPIPALDGGRLFFILLEGVIGKKVSPKIEGYIHTIGMAVLLFIVLLVTFKDVLQLFR
jgi:regulator of sigma E protease